MVVSTSAGDKFDCEGLKRQVFLVSVPDVQIDIVGRYSNWFHSSWLEIW
jgi:hypothetical protein